MYTLEDGTNVNYIPREYTGVAKDIYNTNTRYLKGKLHHNSMPAMEYVSGGKWWYREGNIHRTNGPAYEGPNRLESRYIDGEEIIPKTKVVLVCTL